MISSCFLLFARMRPATCTRILLVGLNLCALTPQPCRADSPPRQVDLSRFPATRMEDVVVQLPSEVFNEGLNR